VETGVSKVLSVLITTKRPAPFPLIHEAFAPDEVMLEKPRYRAWVVGGVAHKLFTAKTVSNAVKITVKKRFIKKLLLIKNQFILFRYFYHFSH
jgi:hypothetical protein